MDLMTIEQAAEYLQLSRETLYKYAQTSKMPAVKVGRHWRFSRQAIDAWINQVSPNRTAADVGDSAPPVPPPNPSATNRASPPLAGPRTESRSLRILVVDDESSLRRLLGAWVEQMGHAVQTAATGQEALALIADQSFDLIFLDLHLPDMDGTAILSRLPAESRPAVVLITGIPGGEVMKESLRYPVTYALSKPFQKADIAGVIEMVRLSL
jgi:excisionase family DNA binding protein